MTRDEKRWHEQQLEKLKSDLRDHYQAIILFAICATMAIMIGLAG